MDSIDPVEKATDLVESIKAAALEASVKVQEVEKSVEQKLETAVQSGNHSMLNLCRILSVFIVKAKTKLTKPKNPLLKKYLKYKGKATRSPMLQRMHRLPPTTQRSQSSTLLQTPVFQVR